MNILTGKKTYIAGGAAIISAVAGVLTGQLSIFEALIVALNGGAVASLRAGVTSEVKKVQQ